MADKNGDKGSRDYASDCMEMYRAMCRVVHDWPWERDEDINGGDLVDYMNDWVRAVRPILGRIEGE